MYYTSTECVCLYVLVCMGLRFFLRLPLSKQLSTDSSPSEGMYDGSEISVASETEVWAKWAYWMENQIHGSDGELTNMF